MVGDKPIIAARANRRASRRLSPRGQVRIECRKGTHGLGQNIAVQVLDLSETGVRLVVKSRLERGGEVEVIIGAASFTAAIKRIARVVWAIPTENERQAVGLNFSPPLDYPSFQRLCSSVKPLR